MQVKRCDAKRMPWPLTEGEPSMVEAHRWQRKSTAARNARNMTWFLEVLLSRMSDADFYVVFEARCREEDAVTKRLVTESYGVAYMEAGKTAQPRTFLSSKDVQAKEPPPYVAEMFAKALKKVVGESLAKEERYERARRGRDEC